MYGTQTRSKWPRNVPRPTINSPCELSLPDQEINMSPYGLNKSVKLKHNRLRPSFPRKSKGSLSKHSNSQLVQKADSQLDANLNICRFFKDTTPIDIIKSYSPRLEDYETTADRMFNLRKRLSPVKKGREEKRVVMSVDATREAVQRTSFLNIQKLELIRIFSQSQKQPDSTKAQESLDERYSLSPTKESRQLKRNSKNLKEEQYITQNVVELRKTLRESYASKWNYSKSRSKTFTIPFERYHYKDFVWKVAFSNGILLNPVPDEVKLKVYVGRGNNSQLVRSLIRRRNWWTFTERWEEANLVWTQLKINAYFGQQQPSPHPLALRQPLSKQARTRNELNLSILNQNDVGIWDAYWRDNRILQEKMTEQMTKRNNYFRKQNLNLAQLVPKSLRIQNHMSQNFMIGNKKALLHTMREYYDSINQDVFQYLPLSFHIVQGFDDPQYTEFLRYYYARRKQSKKEGNSNMWIVKPGELTNRGNGIIVCLTLQEIKAIVKRGGRHFDGTNKTFILQQYIQKPLLYQRRKFDIRHFILVTAINGRHKGYWFKRGYIRTSSSQYTLNHGQANVHLTNDAVQKNMPDYGRYQKGNKVSYEDFQTYLQKEYNGRYDFFGQIYPQMMKIATDTIKASAKTLNPKKLQHNFELFGLDFMIDGSFKPWLIECNSNPCLEISCPLLSSIIPALIENTLKICVDSLAGPPADFTEKRPRFTDNVLSSNEFQLVYDSVLQEQELQGLQTTSSNLNVAELDKEEDQQFQDDGQALED